MAEAVVAGMPSTVGNAGCDRAGPALGVYSLVRASPDEHRPPLPLGLLEA